MLNTDKLKIKNKQDNFSTVGIRNLVLIKLII